jgi:molybdate transport system substrate-binding protein
VATTNIERTKIVKRAVLLLILLTVLRCEYSHARSQILISSAISLKEPLTEIGHNFSRASGVDVKFNFAGSGTLQQQIERGAPVDVFISAANKQMNALAAKNLIDKSSRRVLASNQLVLIAPQNSTLRNFRDLLRARRIAIGAPRSVPAGQYAQQALQNLGLWNRVAAKTVQCKDVREVLTQVQLGNVDVGFVYRTDANNAKVRIVQSVPPHLHSPIRYPAAVVSSTHNAGIARWFLRYLSGEKAQRVLRKHGFLVAR